MFSVSVIPEIPPLYEKAHNTFMLVTGRAMDAPGYVFTDAEAANHAVVFIYLPDVPGPIGWLWCDIGGWNIVFGMERGLCLHEDGYPTRESAVSAILNIYCEHRLYLN